MGLRGGQQCGIYNIQFSGASGLIYAPEDAGVGYSGFDARNRDELLVKINNGTKSGVTATLFGATFDDKDMTEDVYDSDALSGVSVGSGASEMMHTTVNYAYNRVLISGTVAGTSGVIKVVFQADSHGRK